MQVAEKYWSIWFFGLWMFRHRFDVGTMLRVFELNVKNPAFAKQRKIAQMQRVFFEELCSQSMVYPRVTSFDALKQSTNICAHRITFSSRKYIILNQLSCIQSKHTFWEVREHLFCLKYRWENLVTWLLRHQMKNEWGLLT